MDGCENMMKLAKKKRIYKTFTKCFMPDDLNKLNDIPDGKCPEPFSQTKQIMVLLYTI